ncbi:YaaA family protein [Microbacterium radiodurans]|uniref:Peroxide stress protein YaaA n=1 Tax=Microbacterium radiodurans TaxID=661398 RepID=A0A5J5IXC2_9MICO|nr:peroxide stress protein YaaA [Microbacterium radiodurans]KAA9089936.1 peroxide stress protein YaaA [Microbacterium radiodurans]
MLVLLPPSETKHAGGDGGPLDLSALALPALLPQRRATVDALVALSEDPVNAMRVLKLSARQHGEVAVNAAVPTAPTMPAIDRYTGVLYDALHAGTLDAAARRWSGVHVMIQSAPFGPIGALDPIPAYRLAAGTSVPGIPALRRHWAEASTAALAAARPDFILDLRSEAYAALAPVPASVPSAFVRVVTPGEDGAVRALNHFNKHAKGAFTRALAQSRPRVGSRAGLLRWAESSGWSLREGAAGELDLVV